MKATVPATTPPTNQPLRVQSLGEMRVAIGGQSVSWGARSAEELFWYLHAHPEGAPRGQILSELWNQEDTAAAANRFRVALFRVRSALGSPETVTEQGGRFGLSGAIFAASDTAQLEPLLEPLLETRLETRLKPLPQSPLSSDQHGDPATRAEQLRLALTLCQGPYLSAIQESWVQPERERWRGVQAALQLQLAYLHCQQRQCAQATCTLRSALSSDPYQPENLHQRLMGCLNVTQGKYVAIEYYRRYLRFLSEEVGDTPMPETVELAQAIKVGDYVCQEGTPPKS